MDKIRLHENCLYSEATVVAVVDGPVTVLEPLWKHLAGTIERWREWMRQLLAGLESLNNTADKITTQTAKGIVEDAEGKLRFHLLRNYPVATATPEAAQRFRNNVCPPPECPPEFRLLLTEVVEVCRRTDRWLRGKTTKPPGTLMQLSRQVYEKLELLNAELGRTGETSPLLGVGVTAARNASSPKERKRPLSKDRPNEARNKWVYERCCAGAPHDSIVMKLKQLARKRGWRVVSTKQRIHQIGNEYADAHGLKRPDPRQNL
jgi:hypothetical protein